ARLDRHRRRLHLREPRRGPHPGVLRAQGPDEGVLRGARAADLARRRREQRRLLRRTRLHRPVQVALRKDRHAEPPGHDVPLSKSPPTHSGGGGPPERRWRGLRLPPPAWPLPPRCAWSPFPACGEGVDRSAWVAQQSAWPSTPTFPTRSSPPSWARSTSAPRPRSRASPRACPTPTSCWRPTAAATY